MTKAELLALLIEKLEVANQILDDPKSSDSVQNYAEGLADAYGVMFAAVGQLEDVR